MLSRKRLGVASIFGLLLLPGCITHPANPAATQPVTHVDPKQATAGYWLSRPTVARISGTDFYQMWDACKAEVHSRFFQVDRQDYREGTLSTLPMVSKQFFEVWRRDAVTPETVAASSLATIRRSVWFQFQRQPDGSYIAEPKVLIERYASTERRLTAIYEYHAAFSGNRVTGNMQTESGQPVPGSYWYSIGRDAALESNLAAAVQVRLQKN
jgi:hypothetical protein